MPGKPIPFRYSSTPPPKETARDHRDHYEKSRGKLVEPLDKEPRKKQIPQPDVPIMSSTITMAKIREVDTSEEHIQEELDLYPLTTPSRLDLGNSMRHTGYWV
ncbi:hypothetical protein M422DRAFT_270211 [Sphaerobolus stellatus SS14]|uniref:Uncharacterized protein n=1 Tax=Sphaerobolus stellatus (strain SS14) TaxID=990650 RepID=A0A0C9UT67_SPHS4|nr:hypothetical protein M422DRAFT_270211 [Sphaerobolus stellatus SS14]